MTTRDLSDTRDISEYGHRDETQLEKEDKIDRMNSIAKTTHKTRTKSYN
jgi:hypothetical protein